MKSRNRFQIAFWGSLGCHIVVAILLVISGILAVRTTSEKILEVAIVGGGGSGKGARAAASEMQVPSPQPNPSLQPKPILPDDIVENKKEIEREEFTPSLPQFVSEPSPANVNSEANRSRTSGETVGVKEAGNGKDLGKGGNDGNGSGTGDGNGDATGIGNPAIPPRLIHHQKPNYPMSARNREIEGTTVVKFIVSAKGNVEESFVEESSGSGDLDVAALKAVKEWKFIPAKDNYGRDMRCYAYVPINFRLR